MKKVYYLVFAFFFCLPLLSEATHLMGGEITATRIGTTGETYEVTLTLYRDTMGVAMDSSIPIEVKDDAGVVISNHSTPQAAGSGALIKNLLYGVQVYYFIDTVTLAGPGTYHISTTYCCRNSNIVNGPANQNLYLETKLTHFNSNLDNSTARFLVEPVVSVPVGLVWQYNPLPFETHGDSLAWKIDVPLVGFGMPVPGYTAPPGPMSMNPHTGTITWEAGATGNYVISILVEEYRDGNLIGEIRRDMELVVVDIPDATLPYFPEIDTYPMDPNGNVVFDIDVYLGNFHLELLAADDNQLDSIEMLAFGEPLDLAITPATFFDTLLFPNEVVGIFDWNPDVSLVRDEPYIMVFRVWDHQFAHDEAILFNVINTNAIEKPIGLGINQLYPNPAKDALYLSLNVDKASDLEFKIYTPAGMLVKNLRKGFYPSGQHVIRTDIEELAAGFYFLTIEQDGKLVKGQKFVVTK